MKKLLVAMVFALMTMSNVSYAAVAQVSGKIVRVMAGANNWYGVRFYLDITSDGTNGLCNPAFVYSEPDSTNTNGHDQKVAVFLAAYMSGKNVDMTVELGRGGFCVLNEGSIY